MSELPSDWEAGSFGEIVNIIRGVTFPASSKVHDRSDEVVACLRTSHIQDKLLWDNIYFIPKHFVRREEQLTRRNDILMSMANSSNLVGKVCINESGGEACFGAFLAAIRCEQVNPKYVYYFLRSTDTQSKLRANSSQTVNIANISVSELEKLEIPIAPFEEQKRIAQKLDTLLAQIDALEARIDAIPTLVERMRKSVLASAMIGSVAAFSPPLVSSTGSRTKLTLGDETLDVPAGWGSASLGSLLDSDRKLCYGVVQPGLEVESGIEMVRVCDIDSGKIAWDNVRKIASDVDNEYRRSRIARGDILLSIVGSIGRAAIVRKDSSANIARAVARLSVDRSRLTPEWLFLWLTCPSVQWWLASSSKEVARKTLNLKELSELPVLLPTIAEQTEIVRRVEQLFAIADQLEAKVSAAKQRIDSLTQSLLAKAFRGELVPQDPNDEPASLLLERIRAQRADVPKPKRGRKAASN